MMLVKFVNFVGLCLKSRDFVFCSSEKHVMKVNYWCNFLLSSSLFVINLRLFCALLNFSWFYRSLHDYTLFRFRVIKSKSNKSSNAETAEEKQPESAGMVTVGTGLATQHLVTRHNLSRSN